MKTPRSSSGSSAGPGSATAAGCVGFAIGTETLGSISSPSSTNGVTGLRPTFGRVPRTGAMALVWSMDKIGPMTRSVEDAALVFGVLHGPDGRDLSCRVREVVQQGPGAWPNTFRKAHLIPAVDYINANRVRAVAIARWAELFRSVDVIVTPTGAANQLTATNLTGHPACILPNGFRDGTPINVSITFLGSLFGEANLLRVAHAYQQATGFHVRHPALA